MAKNTYWCKMNPLWPLCFIVLHVEGGGTRRGEARWAGVGGFWVGWWFFRADGKGSDLVPPRCPRPASPSCLSCSTTLLSPLLSYFNSHLSHSTILLSLAVSRTIPCCCPLLLSIAVPCCFSPCATDGFASLLRDSCAASSSSSTPCSSLCFPDYVYTIV